MVSMLRFDVGCALASLDKLGWSIGESDACKVIPAGDGGTKAKAEVAEREPEREDAAEQKAGSSCSSANSADSASSRRRRRRRQRSDLLASPALGGSFSSTVSNCSSFSYQVDKNYNFELPSHQVYMSEVESYVGQFSETRRKLDKTFHGFYKEDRQLVQDQIVSYVLRSSGSMKRQRQPWIIFTAGAMGSGKSHTLRLLKQSPQLAALASYVLIDQDEIRSLLPEWGEYVKKSSRKAASLLQKESGYMCEIALTESLNASRNIVFDSSLRDHAWWRLEFARMRSEFPQYRIAILYIKTDLETAIQRTERRALRTGRAVPREAVVQSHEQSAHSFELLKEHAQLTAVIDSSASEPAFVEPSLEAFVDAWSS